MLHIYYIFVKKILFNFTQCLLSLEIKMHISTREHSKSLDLCNLINCPYIIRPNVFFIWCQSGCGLKMNVPFLIASFSSLLKGIPSP